jgi:hypothetical protein
MQLGPVGVEQSLGQVPQQVGDVGGQARCLAGGERSVVALAVVMTLPARLVAFVVPLACWSLREAPGFNRRSARIH